MESFRPTNEWGPKDPKTRESWLRTPPTSDAVTEVKELFQKIRKHFVR